VSWGINRHTVRHRIHGPAFFAGVRHECQKCRRTEAAGQRRPKGANWPRKDFSPASYTFHFILVFRFSFRKQHRYTDAQTYGDGHQGVQADGHVGGQRCAVVMQSRVFPFLSSTTMAETFPNPICTTCPGRGGRIITLCRCSVQRRRTLAIRTVLRTRLWATMHLSSPVRPREWFHWTTMK